MAEIEKLKFILRSNEYPTEVIKKAIEKFLRKKAEAAVSVEPDVRQKRYFKLPHAGRKSEEFAHRLKILVVGHFPLVDFNVVYQTPRTLGDLFPFKDRIGNKMDMSGVVYSMKCKTCEAEYIGETTIILRVRIDEHRSSKKDNTSACKQHVVDNPGHIWDYDGVTVLGRANTEKRLEIKELLRILQRQPAVNKKIGLQSKYEFKKKLIKAHFQFRAEK